MRRLLKRSTSNDKCMPEGSRGSCERTCAAKIVLDFHDPDGRRVEASLRLSDRQAWRHGGRRSGSVQHLAQREAAGTRAKLANPLPRNSDVQLRRPGLVGKYDLATAQVWIWRSALSRVLH